MPVLNEWHSKNILNKFNYVTWNESIRKIHSEKFETLKNSHYLRRLIFDEIMSNFLTSSQIRKKIKKIKKKEKNFNPADKDRYLKKLNYKLTNDQKNSDKILSELIKVNIRQIFKNSGKSKPEVDVQILRN